MKLSQSFARTQKSVAEESINYQLLVRGGFINQVAAGVYSYLPLGLRVLAKISDVVRQEMNAIGAEEILLPVLQPKANWETTGRWKDFDVLYRIKDQAGREFALGPTHEEMVAPLAKTQVLSYKDLPKKVYQIQTKFRDELRAKSGLLRGREFLMKDLYSLHADEQSLEDFYAQVVGAYFKIFKRLGLDVRLVKASGGSFSQYSDEFQLFCDSGEDTVFYCDDCDWAENQEIAKVKEGDDCPECKKGRVKVTRAIEVGNTFRLGTRFPDDFDFHYTDKDGKQQPVIMASYGIGISRLMGAMVEVSHDERGIIWPDSVAPADIHLVSIGDVKKEADKLYEDLVKAGKAVIYDDRDESAGTKLADADLIGVPVRMVISPKTLEKDSVEVKQRNHSKAELTKLSATSKL